MIDIKSINLDDILPESVKKDKQVENAAKDLDLKLKEVADLIPLALLLPRLDELPEEILDLLAWQYHVDFYKTDMDIAIKRNMIRSSIDWHRHKGTPYAVKQVLKGFIAEAEIIENWEYDGRPYCFKVKLKSGIPDEKTLKDVVEAIKSTKNTRSHLDEFSMTNEIEFGKGKQGMTIAIPIADFKRVEIGLSRYKPKDQTNTRYISGIVSKFRKIEIGVI